MVNIYFLKPIIKVRQIKEILNNIPDDTYISVGTHERNEIEELRNESKITDIRLLPIGFSQSNEKYLKIYIEKYEESGCMRFQR